MPKRELVNTKRMILPNRAPGLLPCTSKYQRNAAKMRPPSARVNARTIQPASAARPISQTASRSILLAMTVRIATLTTALATFRKTLRSAREPCCSVISIALGHLPSRDNFFVDVQDLLHVLVDCKCQGECCTRTMAQRCSVAR